MRLPPFRKPTESRSNNMRAIRSSGNRTTELRLASLLRAYGIRGWCRQPPDVFGNPDVAFPRTSVAVFVDGCFWHGCPRCGHVPKTNSAYWVAKIERNVRMDSRITRKLRSRGYSVIRIWECQLRKQPERCINRIRRALDRSST